MPTCGWIFSFSQEAGSRTASLKRSNQVKGLRHSRSVSWSFSETLQYPWVNSAIAISWHRCFLKFYFALMKNISPSMQWVNRQQTSSWHCLVLRSIHFDFDLIIAVFSTLKQHSCSTLHCKIGVSDMNLFLLSELILNACCLYNIIKSHISYTAFMKWHTHVGMWRISLTFSAKSLLRSPRILFKMEVKEIWKYILKTLINCIVK